MSDGRNFTSDRLKDAVLKELTDQVENGIASADEDGEVTRESVSPQVLGKAIEFLKLYPVGFGAEGGDGNPKPAAESETLAAYKDKMPFKPGASVKHPHLKEVAKG